MANSNGIITAPVRIYDVQQTLGVSGGGDLGTLCQSPKINMWAKYKPVIRRNLIDTISQLNSNNRWKPTTDFSTAYTWWWCGDDTNHGIYVPFRIPSQQTAAGYVAALEQVALLIDGQKNGWSYTPPTGTANAPFRLTDFNQYNQYAPNPVQGASGSDVVYAAASQEFTYSFMTREVVDKPYDDRDFVVPTDLKLDGTRWQNCYLGFAIYIKVSGVYKAMAWTVGDYWKGAGILNSDSTQPDVDTTSDTSGQTAEAHFKNGNTYYALPIYVTDNTIDQMVAGKSRTSANSVKFIPVPYVTFLPFNAVQTSTIEHIVYPSISNNIITRLGSYSTSVTLSSQVAGYNGSTTSFRVDSYFARIDWDCNDATITSDNVLDHENVTLSSFADNTVETIAGLALNVPVVNLNYSWKVVVKVGGEIIQFSLIHPAPIEPSAT